MIVVIAVIVESAYLIASLYHILLLNTVAVIRMNITIDAQKTVWNPLGPLAIVSTITLSAGLVLLCFFAQSYQLGPWAKFKDTVRCLLSYVHEHKPLFPSVPKELTKNASLLGHPAVF